MNNIPILEHIDISYKKVFLDTKIEEDFFDRVYNIYPNTILDMYSSSLEPDSSELLNLDSEYFRLSMEDNYLNFILECFKANSSQCIIDINLFYKKYEDFHEYSNRLDKIDYYILLKHLTDLKYNKSNIYIITDSNLLKMFMKGILREIFQTTLYFPKIPLLLFSNYDMSLPLVFKDNKDKSFYEKIAEKNFLHFR